MPEVKHFSSSGPVLVTAQPLSVICNLLARLMRDVLQMQNARHEQRRPKRFKGSFLSLDERQKSLQRKLWHQPTVMCLRNRLNILCSSRAWVAGGRRTEETWPSPTGLSNSIFNSKNTPENIFSFFHQHCKQRLLWKLEGGSLLLPPLPSPPSLPLSLVWQELFLLAATELRINIKVVAVRPSALYTPAEISCPSPQTICFFLGRNRLLLQSTNPGLSTTDARPEFLLLHVLLQRSWNLQPNSSFGVKKHH